MSDVISTIVARGAGELNIDLPPDAGAAFKAYYDFLEKHGENVNLTAISGAEDVVRLHFLDSVALLNVVKFKTAKVIDIGTGAGFPGIPLKIAEPSIDLTLLDATGKKISFLSSLCNELGIKAEFINARAEEAAHEPNIRESFDIAVSRAVARLNMLCELSLPFVRTGGCFIAMKSADSDDEIAEAENAVNILGGNIQECYSYTIPGTERTNRAVIIRKISETPASYPRRFAKMQKSPL